MTWQHRAIGKNGTLKSLFNSTSTIFTSIVTLYQLLNPWEDSTGWLPGTKNIIPTSLCKKNDLLQRYYSAFCNPISGPWTKTLEHSQDSVFASYSFFKMPLLIYFTWQETKPVIVSQFCVLQLQPLKRKQIIPFSGHLGPRKTWIPSSMQCLELNQ